MCTREPVTGSEDIIDTAKVHVPILTNPKIIQPGTELLVCKATKRPHGDSEMSDGSIRAMSAGDVHFPDAPEGAMALLATWTARGARDDRIRGAPPGPTDGDAEAASRGKPCPCPADQDPGTNKGGRSRPCW